MWGRTSSAERSGERLAERRRSRRRRSLIALAVLILLCFGLAVYGLRQDAVRISHVEIFGADASLAHYATDAMQGWYGGIIPRNSIFFFPEESIRAAILAADSDIAGVSIFRKGFNGLSIKIDNRAPIARWCGLAPTVFEPGSAHGSDEYCYVFDASGVIYAAASSTQTVNPFILYAPLAGDTEEPLQANLANAQMLPAVFDFARELATLGSPVTRIVIHDGEVDDYLASGTRVSYVLGHEEDAFTALVSARENLNLADGSLLYVDLRFDGKVYLKKKE